MATAHDHFISFLITACTISKCELTPWSARCFAGTVSATVTTTVGVISSVHDDTTYSWADALAAATTGGTDFDVLVLFVANYANAGFAVDQNFAHLSGWKFDGGVAVFFGHELSFSAGRAGVSSMA